MTVRGRAAPTVISRLSIGRLGGIAQVGGREALPANLIGLAVAGVFVADRARVHRMLATAFSLLTPFFFLKAGSLVSLPAIVAGAGLIALLLAVKVGAKVIGVWPTARAFGRRHVTRTTRRCSCRPG
jgi:Kef-type K+ transport system membrane component KefB